MHISVIICTYNRCESLRRTLVTLCALNIPAGVEWEVIVADNNSKDATPAVCDEFKTKLPLRYLFEPKQGKSNALNTSMQQALGKLHLFTDDDVDVTPDWVAQHLDAAARYPDAGFFSGRVVPRWETTPPKWVEEHSRTVLSGVTVCYQPSETEMQVTADMCGGLGANLCLRQGVLDRAGISFRKDLGPSGGDQVRYEEVLLLRQLVEKGFPGIHIPTAIVYHRNSSERMTEKYVREYLVGEGIALARMGWIEPSKHIWFGVPRYLWRKCLENAILYVLTRYTRPSGVWLRHETRAAGSWGSISELRRLRKR